MRVDFLFKTSKKSETLVTNRRNIECPIRQIFKIFIGGHYKRSCFKNILNISIFERVVTFLLIFFQQMTTLSLKCFFSRLKGNYEEKDKNLTTVFFIFILPTFSLLFNVRNACNLIKIQKNSFYMQCVSTFCSKLAKNQKLW